METVMMWFKNDLRLHDNEALHRALSSGKKVLFYYCIDTAVFDKEILHFKKAGGNRKLFLLQSLLDLQESLQKLDADLLVEEGDPVKKIADQLKQHTITSIYCEQEYAAEERELQKRLATEITNLDCSIKPYWGKTLYHIDDLPYTIDKIPQTSKAFRINTSKKAAIRAEFVTPTEIPHSVTSDGGIDLNSLIADLQNEQLLVAGGETAALERLDHYTFDTELLTSYKWTRNRSLGMDYSSKLSPYMALGCISPRRIYHQVIKYETEVKKNISTWWLVFEVVWRDFFTFKAMRVGNAIFSTSGFTNKEREFTNKYDWFERWCNGTTGVPFIDAHMRQLNKTGFMSNRGRVNCSSFLVFDLQVDWTWGAAYFESKLIDYDVTSNWMNWHNQAYQTWYTNPVNQSLKYKAAEYIKKWIPELQTMTDEFIYIPWTTAEKPDDYPDPVVLPSKWSRAIGKIEKAAATTL